MLLRVLSGLPRPQRLLRQCSRECCRDYLARKVCVVNARRDLSGLPRPQRMLRECLRESFRHYPAREECPTTDISHVRLIGWPTNNGSHVRLPAGPAKDGLHVGLFTCRFVLLLRTALGWPSYQNLRVPLGVPKLS